MGREYLIGGLLALARAFLAGLYLFIGRGIRSKIDNLSYVFPLYTMASITLLVICLINGENMINYDFKTWGFFFLLALIPTVIGHSLYNWLLGFIPAHKVATTVLGEPIGASILAVIFFSQIPGWWSIFATWKMS